MSSLRFAMLLVLPSFVAGAVEPAPAPARETTTIHLEATREATDLAERATGAADGHRVADRVYRYRVESPDSDLDGWATQFGHIDETSGTGTHRGNGYWKLDSGDEVFVLIDGTQRRSGEGASAATSFEGTFEFLGGTGKYRGATGKGSYSGTADANGARWTGSATITR
ncbi:MAG TPA: hypothetical protein VFL14_00705 [Xanthomonadales bacterium]|nr:hypothetical protein [Xanthomonadales bacterium]